ncbi:MAG: chromate efflux transporter [Pseudomonadota bacterium]
MTGETVQDNQTTADANLTSPPSFGELIATWARIGVLSFGGPAGQIALMHRTIVEEKRWLSEAQYLSALNFCMLLPGPEAMQLATYVGWRTHGVAGGIAAGLLFVIPGAAVVLALSSMYVAFGAVPAVAAIFVGVKAAVLAIVIDALLKVARRALKLQSDWLIAAAAFVAIFVFKVPFPLIILTAAFVGYLRVSTSQSEADWAPSPATDVSYVITIRTIAIWGAVWLAPLAAIVLSLGSDHVLSQAGWFFSKLAVVTFGGAYAVLAYMAQEVVQNYGWLTPGEMLDGLGLAETTPGPLILVLEFVGFIAGFRDGGWPMALAAAFVTLWATFAPCFLWIFAGAPYVEWLNAQPKLKGALSAVTAAVVGVILNLSVWFALNVLFKSAQTVRLGPVSIELPQTASLDGVALGLAGIAVMLMFGFKRGVLTTLGVGAALALGWHAAVA